MAETARPARRIVLCRGDYCNLGRRADILYRRLKEAVDETNSACPPLAPCLGLRTANCLSMCGNGPNLVIYPEDAVFNRVDAEALERIIAEYVRTAGTSSEG